MYAGAMALCLAVVSIWFTGATSLWAQASRTQVEMAVDYTLSVQGKNGLFGYEYDFLSGRWSPDDNVVRQAGTSYALALAFSQTGDEQARAGVLAALAALSARSVAYAGGQLLSSDGSLEDANAGGTALALIAALLTEGPGARAQGWLDGLVALQRADGRFSWGPLRSEPSPYFDGEAWLAFSYAAQLGLLDDSPEGALKRADAGLMKTYLETPESGFFHWGQLAAELRYESTSDPQFVWFSAQQVAHYFAEMRPNVSDSANGCSSVEGLAAAWTTLKGNPGLAALRENVELRIDRVLAIADTLQIKPGAKVIWFRDGVTLALPEIERFTGAFLNGRTRPQTRIDVTQHCIAAFLAAEKKGLGEWGR